MKNNKENWEKEEWGGWKIVSNMLDHPDKNGIYSTSKCYQELYEFVVSQKEKARQEEKAKLRQLIEESKTRKTLDFGKDGQEELISRTELLEKIGASKNTKITY